MVCAAKVQDQCLVDGDLASLVFLRLGNHNSEDSVLHGSLDVVGIDADWEGKRTRELANAAFTDPVLLLRLGRLLLPLGDFGVLGRSFRSVGVDGVFVFDGGVMIRWSFGLAIGDRASGLGRFDETCWWSTRSVGALGAATNHQSLRIGELDFDVLLIDTWKLAVQLVCLPKLLDVELGSEILHVAATLVMVVIAHGGASIVGVKVVKETEERVEGGRVV